MPIRFFIVTPALNQLARLKRCVASIRDQQVGPEVEVEHWIVDGASTDGTVEWLTAQWLHYISEPDRSMYDALNKGLALLSDRVTLSDDVCFAWLNADEQYLPGALAKVARQAATCPQVDLFSGGALLVDESGQLLTYWKSMPLRSFYLRAGVLYNLSCGMFMRARALRESIRFDASKQAVADLLFVQALLKQGATTACLPGYLATYTFSPHNVSNQGPAREEHRRLQRPSSASEQLCVFAARAARAAERVLRGTRRETFPLEYAIYTDPFMPRVSFCSGPVPARWPTLEP